MEYNFTYSGPHDAHLFGTNNNGIGVFFDPHCEDGGWCGNVAFYDHDILMFGPYKTMEEAKAVGIQIYEERVTKYGADYNIVLSEYLGFALELDSLLKTHSCMNVYGALKMAVCNMKMGKPAKALIMGDYDKYRDGFMEYEIPCLKLREILIRHNMVDKDGYTIR